MQTAVPLILGAVRSIAMATYRYKKNLQLLQVLQAFHMCRNKKITCDANSCLHTVHILLT